MQFQANHNMATIAFFITLLFAAHVANAKPGMGRIVNGDEVKPNSIPYQVGMFMDVEAGRSFCGGTLLSENYVLTAAHCVDTVKGIDVILGAHRVGDYEATQQRIPAEEWHWHKDWDLKALRNDIAVVKLSKPATLNENVKLVELPKRSQVNESFADEWGRISGWGKTSDAAITISAYLQKIDVLTMSTDECNVFKGGWITFDQICTIGMDGKSPCEGDSGGPLVVDEVQVGVASYVPKAGCETGIPSVFTRVSRYLDWIEEHSDVTISE